MLGGVEMRGVKGKEKKVICPKCQGAMLTRAKMGVGATKPDERLFHCKNCGEVFTGEEIRVNWRANQRPPLEVVP
jgi:ribosomal protein L37AE/L43A